MPKLVFLLLCVIYGCKSMQLPSYMRRCYCDSNLAQCAMDNVPRIKPHLKDGIKELYLPKLVPFHMDSLILETGNDLALKVSNLDIFDLDTFEMKNATADLVGRHFSITLHFDVVHMTATYYVNGRFLVLPIKGNGSVWFTIEQLNCKYDYDFELFERNGIAYMKFHNSAFEFESGKIGLRLDNLFNGDKALGDQVNDFLNENWKEVENILRDPISNTIKDVIGKIFDQISENVPLSVLCPSPDK